MLRARPVVEGDQHELRAIHRAAVGRVALSRTSTQTRPEESRLGVVGVVVIKTGENQACLETAPPSWLRCNPW